MCQLEAVTPQSVLSRRQQTQGPALPPPTPETTALPQERNDVRLTVTPPAPSGVALDPATHSAQTASALASALAGPQAAAAATVARVPPPVVCSAVAADIAASLPPGKPMMIPADQVKTLQARYGLDDREFLLALIPTAKGHATPLISNYHVGAAGMGASGAVYLGVNEEYDGAAINSTTHGEQFVVINALVNHETSLKYLAVSAEPCGHCRQWLNELNKAHQMQIIVPDAQDETLVTLLKSDFGPQDLGVKGALMTPQPGGYHLVDVQPGDDEELDRAAADAANQSYAPYSHNVSGVAIRTHDGTIVAGSYAENAAFNPSMGPLQADLINLVASGHSRDDIADVVLVQTRAPKTDTLHIVTANRTYEVPVNSTGVDQALSTFSVLRQIAPDARFVVRHVEPDASDKR